MQSRSRSLGCRVSSRFLSLGLGGNMASAKPETRHQQHPIQESGHTKLTQTPKTRQLHTIKYYIAIGRIHHIQTMKEHNEDL